MNKPSVSSIPLPEFSLWEKMKKGRALFSFDLEITARCNNNCRHCYINVPAGDKGSKEKELSLEEIRDIADEAASLGALWCLITGGEPLLREDFADIYLCLRKKGLLVSVFTNATLVRKDHVRLFKKHPPRNVEVTVYGATEETYELVTRRPGSFESFLRGVDLLFKAGVNIDLKAMALRSNKGELPQIARFCRERSRAPFRFDPLLHLRFDADPVRNEEIIAERLSPREIAALERGNPERLRALKKECDTLIVPEFSNNRDSHLFYCGAGENECTVSSDGLFRLCSSLWHPGCVYDLRKGSLTDAWHHFVPQVRGLCSHRKEFLERCRACPLINLCMWCPAHASLETGEIDLPVNYFCEVAHARAEALKKD